VKPSFRKAAKCRAYSRAASSVKGQIRNRRTDSDFSLIPSLKVENWAS